MSLRSHLILKKAFRRLQKQNPAFSVRAVARKVGVSHVFMGKILNGEVALPVKRMKAIAEALQLDDLAFAELKTSMADQRLGKELAGETKTPFHLKKSAVENFEEQPLNAFTAIENWYELPILDLLTCEGVDTTTKNLAERLGLTESQTQSAIKRLLAAGFITEIEGRLQKTDRYIRFPTRIPMKITQRYYRQVLQKAHDEFKNEKPSDFEKRFMQNLTIAVNPDKIDLAKERLQQFLYDLSLELSDGEAQEVYFMTSLFFPVTTKR